MNIYRKILIVIIIIAIIMGIGIFIDETNRNKKTTPRNEVEQTLVKSPVSQDKDKYYDMDEKTRIKKYMGEIFFFYELGDYKSAYDRLNADFKAEYFKDLDSFTEYIKETYPSSPSLNYVEFNVEGELFVVKVTVLDMKDNTYETINQRFVIRELGPDNYTYSFQKDTVLTKDDVEEIPEDV